MAGLMKLWCVIDGESIAFSAKALPSDSVDDLKKKIFAENKAAFKDFDPKDLTLWHIPNGATKAELPAAPRNKLSDEWETLQTYFPSGPQEKRIHIVIHRPQQVTDVIKKVVLKDAILRRATIPGDVVSLKDRDFTFAIELIMKNVEKHIKGSKSKPDFHMLVSGGAPGIELFKNTINNLASFMLAPATPIFVQTFLSGTAPQVVIAAKEASRISFGFIGTSSLSLQARLEIAEHYAETLGAEKFACGTHKWKLSEFFRNINNQDFNNVYMRTKDGLERRYNIYAAVKKNAKLSQMLLHHSISGSPVERTTSLDPGDKETTIVSLERDAHIILDAADPSNAACTKFVIKMPLFFVSLYNDILQVVDFSLQKTLQGSNDMHWQEWEIFVETPC
ncbi:hypothetical protein BGX26_005746 [Mortierella sp. AD094]|nr:hypothetical protein BGX26_005746 [Mortierella sp. AD094]